MRYGETIPVRLETQTAEVVALWAAKRAVSRSEAIRRLVELGLSTDKVKREKQ